MKKTIFITLFVLVSICSMAQTKIGYYHSSYFGKEFPIFLNVNEFGGKQFDIYTGHHKYSPTSISFNRKKMKKLHTWLKDIKHKLAEWDAVAKVNQVQSVEKELEFITIMPTYSWYFGPSWFFSYPGQFDFKAFLVVKDEKAFICLKSTSRVISTQNRYIDIFDLGLYFGTPEEIDRFIALTSDNYISNEIDKRKSESQLFK